MTQARPTLRIVSAWFPDLAMDRWRAITRQSRTLPGPDVPVVLATNGPHGPVIHAASPAAQARGVQIGTRVVDARAVHPDLHVEPADPQGDLAMLDRLALWSRRWCPWTVRDASDGIVLDTTGAAHLFGGEDGLLHDIVDRFAMHGLTARVAMAPTRGAAQAIARHGKAFTICDADNVVETLSPLPARALRIGDETARLLDRLGLKTIGMLMEVPRPALMRRFVEIDANLNPLILLDRATGRLADPLEAPPDCERRLVRTPLAEPVMEATPHLRGLAELLCADLVRAGEGARLLRLTIYRVDGDWRAIEVNTGRATRDAAHILRLLEGKLDGMDPGFGFDLLTLEAVGLEPLDEREQGLGAERDADANVSALLDRLTARLGRDRVRWSAWHESHVPERVERRVPALGVSPTDMPDLIADRPIRILDPAEEVRVIYDVPDGPPARFVWRRMEFDVVRREGPERIAPEWWRDRPGTRLRDYFKVEVQDGRRFWLFREGLLQDRRGGAPRWFLHGAFA